MLGAGGFTPTPCNSASVLASTNHSIIFSSLLFPYKTHQIHVFSHASSFGSFSTGRSGFCVSALRKRGKENSSLLEKDGFDYDDDDFDDDDDEDDDEGMFVPFGKMKKWFENKPRGFGEGKVYDTSIEDKLLEELEQSRQAQLANINKLNNNPPKPHSREGHRQVQKAPEPFSNGVRVRLFKLPKKKNVHRDLLSVFKEVPGIINIVPAVTGNKKTRDPICKGFAFIDLKSREDANRFVQTFSGQSITFGKIQKQIKCEIINPPCQNSASEPLASGTNSAPEVIVSSMEGNHHPDVDFHINNASLNSREETTSNEYEGPEDNRISAKWEEIGENLKFVRASKINDDGDGMKPITESATASSSSRQPDKTRTTEKKQVLKRKVEKVPKLNIPGSANRLKVKEKAVLTGVFSKYGVNAAPDSRES